MEHQHHHMHGLNEKEMDHSEMSHSHLDHEKDHSMEMEVHDHHGHTGMIADFRKRFFVVLTLTIPIMLLSPMIQHWMNVDWKFSGSNYLLLLLSTVVFAYGGYPFLAGFLSEV